MYRDVEFEQTDALVLRLLSSRRGAKSLFRLLLILAVFLGIPLVIATQLGLLRVAGLRTAGVLAAVFVAFWFLGYLRARKQTRALLAKLPHRRVRWNFTEDHARVEGPLGSSEFTWQMLEAVWRCTDHWQLVFLGNAHAIPMEVVDDELAGFFFDVAHAVGAKVCRESFLGISLDKSRHRGPGAD